jgi:CDP-glucose 4,6-dehydratase
MPLEQLPYLHSLSGPVLITGHSGFKGTWLTLLLEKLGIEVVGYSLSPEKDSLFDRANRTGAISELFADVRDYQRLDTYIKTVKPSAIIHMAAQPYVLESYRIPKDTFEVNIMGTVNVLNSAFACSSVQAVVVVTTDKVYKNNNSGRAFIESDPLEGKDPYSASKVGAEAVVAAWQQIQRTSGGPIVVAVRAGNVIGGGDWGDNRLLPDLIRSFSSGQKMTVRNPASTRPWQHVLDPLRGYISTLEAILNDERIISINFGPESKSIEVAEVVKVAVKTWGRETSIDLDDSGPRNVREAESLDLNTDYSKNILGWGPYWTQEEAVISTVQWWDKVLNRNTEPKRACDDDIESILMKDYKFKI